jgi:hypothetical protein
MKGGKFMASRSTVDVCSEILMHGFEVENVKCESTNWLGPNDELLCKR